MTETKRGHFLREKREIKCVHCYRDIDEGEG